MYFTHKTINALNEGRKDRRGWTKMKSFNMSTKNEVSTHINSCLAALLSHEMLIRKCWLKTDICLGNDTSN